jgi:hypothetical protein
LLCEECTDGQIDSLAKYGNDAVPRLLNEVRGPVARDVDRHRALVNSEWQRIRSRRPLVAGPDLAFDSARMVNRAADAFRASYQRRALWALYRIGTPRARQAIAGTYRADSIAGQTLLSPGARRLADSLRHLP